MNFQLLINIIIEKCSEDKSNTWLNQLKSKIQEDLKFIDRLESINEQVSYSKNNMTQESFCTNQSTISSISPSSKIKREAMFQFFKMNNNSIMENIDIILSKSRQQQDIEECFNHPLFEELREVISSLDKKETNLIQCITQIGKSLRDDYDEPTFDSDLTLEMPEANSSREGNSDKDQTFENK